MPSLHHTPKGNEKLLGHFLNTSLGTGHNEFTVVLVWDPMQMHQDIKPNIPLHCWDNPFPLGGGTLTHFLHSDHKAVGTSSCECLH